MYLDSVQIMELNSGKNSHIQMPSITWFFNPSQNIKMNGSKSHG